MDYVYIEFTIILLAIAVVRTVGSLPETPTVTFSVILGKSVILQTDNYLEYYLLPHHAFEIYLKNVYRFKIIKFKRNK